MYSRTATVGVVFCVLVAGCVGSPGGRDLDGTVDIYVGNHDQPVDEFQHLNVTVTAVTFVPGERENGEPNTATNGTPTERFEPSVNRTTVDLTSVQGDVAAFVDTVSLPVRDRYRTVSLTLSVESAVLSSGNETSVGVPNGTLTMDTSFEVEPESGTTLLIDVTAGEGENGTYTLTADATPVERNLTTPTAGGPTVGSGDTGQAGRNDGNSTDNSPTPTPTPATTATERETGAETTTGG